MKTPDSQAPAGEGLIGVEAVRLVIRDADVACQYGGGKRYCAIEDQFASRPCACQSLAHAAISAHLEALRAAGYEIVDMKARARQFVKERLRDRPELTALIAKSRAAYEAMSPEEREAHDKAQRDSWVRGNIERDRLEREMIAASPPCDTKGETDGGQ